MRIEVEEHKKAGAPLWMCTFADLMSLLLTFFLLLLSMSSTELAKFRAMAGSLRDAFGAKSDLAIAPISMSDEILPQIDERRGDESSPAAGEFERELTQSLERAGVEIESAMVQVDQNTVSLRLESDLLFPSGDAALRPEAIPVLDAVARYVKTTNYTLDIAGHTDNVPIQTSTYPSNWELSAARAGSAVRHLTERGVDSRRLRAIGCADTEPVADNSTADGRSANRRVEFVFTRPRAARTLRLPAKEGVEPPGRAADSVGE
jgi:chemotaxis protein MotB